MRWPDDGLWPQLQPDNENLTPVCGRFNSMENTDIHKWIEDSNLFVERWSKTDLQGIALENENVDSAFAEALLEYEKPL